MGAGYAADMAGDDLVVPLHSRRRRRGELVQKLNHAIPAAGLLTAAFQALNAGAQGVELALAVAEIVTSVVLLRLLVRSIRAVRAPRAEHAHHGVDWYDVWAAGMLFLEAAERYHLRHRIPAATLTTAAATLAIGLLHGRLAARNEQRRSMRLTRDHLVIGGRNKFVKAFRARWDEIADIQIGDREAAIRTRHGKTRRLSLADLENAPAVREALTRAQQRLPARQQERQTS
jgi:hypothetical protein